MPLHLDTANLSYKYLKFNTFGFFLNDSVEQINSKYANNLFYRVQFVQVLRFVLRELRFRHY